MAYRINSHSKHCEMTDWQNKIWYSLTLPCILGLACAEETMIPLLQSVFASSTTVLHSPVKDTQPWDTESYALAMDLAIGEAETSFFPCRLQGNIIRGYR